jgi:hypothetical protein
VNAKNMTDFVVRRGMECQFPESRVRRKSHARFGGGCGETQVSCAPCAYPTGDGMEGNSHRLSQ